ncbi:hypothetical protein GEMRC1_001579 [Eukaryota sp. GEM-RC1]
MSSSLRSVVCILGVTASGKSKVALELCKHLSSELVNVDIMQVYSNAPIATNQSPPEEQQSVPHHLLGILDSFEDVWDVGQFSSSLKSCIENIQGLPVLCDCAHHLNLDATIDYSSSIQDCLNLLNLHDPDILSLIHSNDVRKLQNAAINLCSGFFPSKVDASRRERRLAVKPVLIWVDAEVDVLFERIDKRVDQMVKMGLLEENLALYREYLKKHGSFTNKTFEQGVFQAIGVKEIIKELVRLDFDCNQVITRDQLQLLLQEGVNNIKIETKRYVKKST